MDNAAYGKLETEKLGKKGKFKKQNWCKTCEQQERLFKMDIQTKLYVTQSIWQWLSRNM